MFATPKAAGRPSLAGQSFLNASISGRRSLQTTPRSTPNVKRSSHTEHVLEETSEHVVTVLNTPVPVQVQETLRTSRGDCAVHLDGSGWAWLVAGNRLLLWRYCSQQMTAQCVQVTLPNTGGGWSSKTIAIATNANEKVLPLLACSPEGKLFHWTNALRETSVTREGHVPLNDSVPLSLSPLPSSDTFVLALSGAQLFIVSPLTDTQLHVHEVQAPRGVLSGFSRRVSSLFFGGGGVPESQQTRRVVLGKDEEGLPLLFVLTHSHLQRWILNDNGEELSYNADLIPVLKESVLLNQWVESEASTNQMTVCLVDMQLSSDLVVVLFALALEGSTNAEYGLALFSVRSVGEPTPDVDNLLRLSYTTTYHPGGADSALLKYCLIGSSSVKPLVMFNRHTALLINVARETPGLPDMVTFSQPNSILGGGPTHSGLILFTLHQGIVSITSSSHTTLRSVPGTPIVRPLTTPTHQPSLIHTTTLMAPEVSQEATEVLKNAFSEYLEGNLAVVESICEEHFAAVTFAPRLDTVGDLAVIGLSNLILDDPPLTSDPNWNEGGEPPGGKSLILIYRLEQKLLAHNKYLQFICDSGLIDKLTAVTVRGRRLDTRRVLCEHAEKIQASISVRRIHNNVTDQLIRVAVRGRSPSPLSKTDQFYTQLSQFEDLLTSFPPFHKDTLPGMQSSQDRVDLVLLTSSLLLTVLKDALLYRQSNAHMFQVIPLETTPLSVAAVPWTASDEMRHILREQINLLFNICGREAGQQDELNVWAHVVSLTEILFGGFKVQIDSLKSVSPESSQLSDVQKVFDSDKTKILSSLMEAGQYQHATDLAERFEDFRVLVQLCEDTGNRGKLAEYMQRYKAQGFSDFLFKWYLDEGQLQQLLSFSDRFPRELSSFLSPHPHLSWLHSLSVKDYTQAHKDLKKMADREVQYVAKKKTLLSLSKLSLLASHGATDGEQLTELDNDLHHIVYQQNIPQESLELADIDSDLMPPLSPQRIVELYVCEGEGDEANFITALEYIQNVYPDDECPEAVQLKCYVWSQAILRDDWTQLSTDDPLKELQKTFFSAIVVEGYNRGLNVLPLLPALPSLLSCALLTERGLSSQPVFQFLLRAGYEQLSRVQASLTSGFDQHTGQQEDS